MTSHAANHASSPPPFKLFVFKQLKPELGIPYGREMLRRMVIGGLFPAPIKLVSQRNAMNAWDERDLVAWLQSRKVASRVMGGDRG